jgi:hypothetical protein
MEEQRKTECGTLPLLDEIPVSSSGMESMMMTLGISLRKIDPHNPQKHEGDLVDPLRPRNQFLPYAKGLPSERDNAGTTADCCLFGSRTALDAPRTEGKPIEECRFPRLIAPIPAKSRLS